MRATLLARCGIHNFFFLVKLSSRGTTNFCVLLHSFFRASAAACTSAREPPFLSCCGNIYRCALYLSENDVILVLNSFFQLVVVGSVCLFCVYAACGWYGQNIGLLYYLLLHSTFIVAGRTGFY